MRFPRSPGKRASAGLAKPFARGGIWRLGVEAEKLRNILARRWEIGIIMIRGHLSVTPVTSDGMLFRGQFILFMRRVPRSAASRCQDGPPLTPWQYPRFRHTILPCLNVLPPSLEVQCLHASTPEFSPLHFSWERRPWLPRYQRISRPASTAPPARFVSSPQPSFAFQVKPA